jgi:MarR family transcriptional regulator, transcriptional regulator for hemolysin
MPRNLPESSAPPIRDIELLRLLWEISRFWRAAMDRSLKPLGLSDAKWRTVLYLSHGPADMSQVELAASMNIEAPTMARLLDRLAADGWIERRPSPRDRRIKTVHLLPKAAGVLRQINRTMKAAREEVLAGLSHSELDACIRTLKTIRDRAERAARGE